jgi:hypothetical protein
MPGATRAPNHARSTALDTFFFKQMYTSIVFHHDKDAQLDSLLFGGDYPCKKIGDQPLH